MNRTFAKLAAAAVVAVASVGVSVGSAAGGGDPSPPPKSDHQRIIDFWTADKVAKAVPRDFVYDPATGKFKPAGRPGGGGGGTAIVGASWTAGGEVTTTTGKVLFALGSSYYVCSADVVDDAKSDKSIIVTAGHCAYDETNGQFASSWMFVPDYDSNPVELTSSGSFSATTTYGCWTASSLVVSNGFATAGGFNETAIVHDYAFAVVGLGGRNGTELDKTVGSQPISYTAANAGTDSWLFGYPASGKYRGKDLVYCRGALGFDANVGGATYSVGCDMTGGSSGGPWFQGFANGSGTQFSVNSYGYSGTKAMFGPKFNSETQSMYQVATTASGNILVG